MQHNERYNELLSEVFVPHRLPDGHSGCSGCSAADSGSSTGYGRSPMGPVWTLPAVGQARQRAGNDAPITAGGNSSNISSSNNHPMGAAGAAPRVGLLPLHPAASVTLQQLAALVSAGGGWPQELAVAPHEALQLYDALVAAVGQLTACGVQTAEDATELQQVLHKMQQELQQLAPELILPVGDAVTEGSKHKQPMSPLVATYLSKQAAKQWAKQLIDVLERWAQSASQLTCPGLLSKDSSAAAAAAAAVAALPAPAMAVELALQQLGAGLVAAMAADAEVWQAAHPAEAVYDYAYQRLHLMDLVLSLRTAGQLPCIIFNFQRGLCMSYARLLVGKLQQAEQHWRHLNADRLVAARQAMHRGAAGGETQAGRSGRSGSRAAAGDEEVGPSSSSGGAGGRDMRVVTDGLRGVVASADEDMPDPSFTLLAKDKARSQVGISCSKYPGRCMQCKIVPSTMADLNPAMEHSWQSMLAHIHMLPQQA